MATTSQVRAWWDAYRCAPEKYQNVPFPGVGRVWNLPVARPAVDAFKVFASTMQQCGYLFRETAGGTFNCRPIAGTSSWSIHAYALAIDLNPAKNPFGLPLRHDYPAEFIQRVEALRTGNGRQVFQWGGRWSKPDAMHWQINCAPADLATGITSTDSGDPSMSQALRLLVAEAIQKGWLDWPDEGTFWLNLCANPDDPQWRNDFEPAWNTWKLAEHKAILASGGGSSVDATARAQAAGAKARADTAHDRLNKLKSI